MFGTIFRMRPKAGQEQTIMELVGRWEREILPELSGYIGECVLQSTSNPGEVIGLVIFDSEASYQQSSSSPAQGQWYQKLRALLESDPEWNDGQIIFASGKFAELAGRA